MSSRLPLRLRYVCARYGSIAVAALLLTSAVAFAAAAAGATAPPETRQVTDQTDQQTVRTSLHARATVTGDTPLYERGELLTDRPVYLLSASPNVTLVATTAVPDGREVAVSQRIVLELSALRDDDVFWTERRTLAATDHTATDGRVRTVATLDVERLARDRLEPVGAATDDVGTVQSRVVVETSYDTGSYTGTTNVTAPLTVESGAVALATPGTDQRQHATPVTRTVVAGDPSPTVAVAGTRLSLSGPVITAGLLGLAALGGAVFVRTVDRGVEDFDAFQRHYESVRYTEWISRGSLPEAGAFARVSVESLLDLVDIAIDSEKRVIHDRSRGTYAVVDGGLMYEYVDGEERPERLYEFGLAPIDGSAATIEQDLAAAEATDASAVRFDGGGDGSTGDA